MRRKRTFKPLKTLFYNRKLRSFLKIKNYERGGGISEKSEIDQNLDENKTTLKKDSINLSEKSKAINKSSTLDDVKDVKNA